MGKWCSVCLPWFGLEEESNKDDEEASSPHLAGAGLGGGVLSGVRGEGERGEREVITVVKLTGNVASPWRLVMIAAAGNNKTPTLRNYWPASLTSDKSNNAHYPHVPLYSRTSEGAEAANEIFAAQEAEWADGYDWLEEDFLQRSVMWPLTLSHTSRYQFIVFSFFVVVFFSSLLYFISHDIGSAPLGWRGRLEKVQTTPWDRRQQLGFMTDRNHRHLPLPASSQDVREREADRGRDDVLWLPLHIQWSSYNLSLILIFIFVIVCF